MGLKEILAGITGGQSQQMQGLQSPMQGFQMPMMQQQPQMLDPYGQQQGGLKAALMGRFMNVGL